MPDSSPPIGRTISHYRIVEKLGGGGMAYARPGDQGDLYFLSQE